MELENFFFYFIESSWWKPNEMRQYENKKIRFLEYKWIAHRCFGEIIKHIFMYIDRHIINNSINFGIYLISKLFLNLRLKKAFSKFCDNIITINKSFFFVIYSILEKFNL